MKQYSCIIYKPIKKGFVMLNIMQFIIYAEIAIVILAIAGALITLYTLMKG